MPFLEEISNVPHVESFIFSKIKSEPAPVMLFGAGAMAVFTIQNLKRNGILPECFCDNNTAKQGKAFLGFPVYSYGDFLKKYGEKKYYVIISNTKFADEIHGWLMKAGEKNPVWKELYSCDIAGPLATNYDFVRANAGKFEEAYNSLADDFSKKTFTNIINFKISGNEAYVKQVYRKDMYFDSGIVKLLKDEVFVDVGAFTGDTIDDFVSISGGKYEKIIALEPDKYNVEVLRGNVEKKKYKNVEIHTSGAWNKREKIKFSGNLNGSSTTSAGDSSNPAEECFEIDAEPLDDLTGGKRVTFIKMDIEGAEAKAIEGAQKLIETWKPKLALSIYHRREDMYKILLMVKALVPEYRFYARHYSETMFDTVLYAVI